MDILYPPRGPIAVRSYDGKGRGIVAIADIPSGTLLELCPVLIIDAEERGRLDRMSLFTYVFMWEPDTREQDLYQGVGRAAIALGMSSLLNHSYEPSARFTRHIERLELELRAARAISKGEEITIDYQMDLWFDPL